MRSTCGVSDTQLPLPLLYLLPGAHATWLMGFTGGILSAILTPLSFWLSHWAGTRTPLFDSSGDWMWLGGLACYGLLLTYTSARPAPAGQSGLGEPSLQDALMRLLEETESSHRELRASYRELAYHYQRLQDSLTAARDAMEMLMVLHQAGTPSRSTRRFWIGCASGSMQRAPRFGWWTRRGFSCRWCRHRV
jgi:hypothetical protein